MYYIFFISYFLRFHKLFVAMTLCATLSISPKRGQNTSPFHDYTLNLRLRPTHFWAPNGVCQHVRGRMCSVNIVCRVDYKITFPHKNCQFSNIISGAEYWANKFCSFYPLIQIESCFLLMYITRKSYVHNYRMCCRL